MTDMPTNHMITGANVEDTSTVKIKLVPYDDRVRQIVREELQMALASFAKSLPQQIQATLKNPRKR